MSNPTTSFVHLLMREDGEIPITDPVDQMELEGSGIREFNANHFGQFVPAGKRDVGFRREGIHRQTIFNHRQVSLIDEASLVEIADGLDIDGEVTERYFGEDRTLFIARHIGVNIVISSLSDGRTLHEVEPPFHIGSTDHVGLIDASVLMIGYNEPCPHPGKRIADAYPIATEGMGCRFVKVARACRGFVGVVSCTGVISAGSEAVLVELPKVPKAEEESESTDEKTN